MSILYALLSLNFLFSYLPNKYVTKQCICFQIWWTPTRLMAHFYRISKCVWKVLQRFTLVHKGAKRPTWVNKGPQKHKNAVQLVAPSKEKTTTVRSCNLLFKLNIIFSNVYWVPTKITWLAILKIRTEIFC